MEAGVKVTAFDPDPPVDAMLMEDELRLCVYAAFAVTSTDDDVVEL